MAGTGTLVVQEDSQGKTINTLPPGGQVTRADSLPVVLSVEQEAILAAVRDAVVGVLAVSAASLPLPAGAATETTLAALRDAIANGGTTTSTPGSPSTDVLTIQGHPNMTPAEANLRLGGVPVTAAAPVPVSGPRSGVATANFTRPANTIAYSAGDIVANSTTLASVAPLTLDLARAADTPFKIHGLRLKTTDTGAQGKTFRVHLYRALPTIANADNGVFSTSESLWIGSVDILLGQAFTDAVKGVALPADGADFLCDPVAGGTAIYALIQTLSDFPPASASVWTLAAPAMKD